MAVFRNLFKDIDGIFETKFENVTIVEGTDYESGYKRGYEDGERVGREQGYSQGLIDGENEAKNKLSSLSVSENGTYIPQKGEIGFKEVKVSVNTQPSQGSYEDGYNDGYQKGLSEGYENGYNEGSSEGYNVGYTNGRSDALAQLKELVVKENGEYFPEDGIGFNKVIVNVPQTGGGSTEEKWLFKDEYIDGARDDLPAPVGGESYTMFLNGGEIATATAQLDGYLVFMGAGVCFCHESDKWIFNIDVPEGWEVTEGTVSIRINETSSRGWTLASDGMGMVHLENGYLYADADPMRLEDEEENVVGSFYQSAPLDLSTLDTGKVYSVWNDVNHYIVTALFYKQTEDEWALNFFSDDYNTLYFANGYLRSYDMSYYLDERADAFISQWDLLNLSILDTSIRYTVRTEDDGSEVAELYYVG